MSWAKVKKINSDMSTPLDVLIKGSKRIGASDDIYAIVSSNKASGSMTFGKFTAKVGGSIRLIAIGESTYSSGVVSAIVSGTSYRLIFTAEEGETTKYIDIPVNEGSVVSISQSGGYFSTSSVKIGATLVDNTLGDFVAN